MTGRIIPVDLNEIGEAAKKASRNLALAEPAQIERALQLIADELLRRNQEIIATNATDVDRARKDGLGDHVVDRLVLNENRLSVLSEGVRNVASLPSPVNQEIEFRLLPNGIRLSRRRVPLGVIGVIYESRPNVTADISSLCLKSGNAVILRGGKESINSNVAIAHIIQNCLRESGLPADAVQLIESIDRIVVESMLKMRDHIDLLIPRGGADLVSKVAAEATMPAITGGIGVCHTYVDSAANVDMATSITYNAKTQRPSVCNALDTILVHSHIASVFLPKMFAVMDKAGVELRCDSRALSIIGSNGSDQVKRANAEDYGQEFLSLVASVKIVDSLGEALAHIETFGSGHSEAIITEDHDTATRFVDEVDASAVFVNASTRFNDGGEFGLGAEVAISTNKIHARGPMGLTELTSYKWIATGSGQIRES